VLDWPLGATNLVAPAVVTVNVLGGPTGADPLSRLPQALADGRVRVHLYGKEARPGRKLGHVTVLGNDADAARGAARRAAVLLAGGDRCDSAGGGTEESPAIPSTAIPSPSLPPPSFRAQREICARERASPNSAQHVDIAPRVT
jgi:hypothetical protein